ncbi:MAG: hypothetical protein AAGN64_09330, partial [Bacteroidota bacterium]
RCPLFVRAFHQRDLETVSVPILARIAVPMPIATRVDVPRSETMPNTGAAHPPCAFQTPDLNSYTWPFRLVSSLNP